MNDSKELKDQRIPIMMTPSEVESIDDWAFKNRIRSRGEAIRRLCQVGLIWDEYKGQFSEQYMKAFYSGRKAVEQIGRMQSSDDMTPREAALALEIVEIFSSLTRMTPILIRAVGGANNLRLGEDLEEVIGQNIELRDSLLNAKPED
ncbi:MAG: hypothetical protein ACK43M_22380 [Allorhizobium sp.]